VEFVRNPQVFSTKIPRIQNDRPIANQIDLNGSDFYPVDRRKMITGDTAVIKLLKGINQSVPSFVGAGGPRKELAFVPQHVNVGIVVAGGTAPGTNAVIHWITQRHTRGYGLTTGKIYGFLGGFRGLGRKGTNNVRVLRLEETEVWKNKGGCELGMSRYREDIVPMVETLKELKIDILYVIGGDGTLEAANKMSAEIMKQGLRIVIAAIPKTIDNDIVWVWETFGFKTAVREAARHILNFHENVRTHGRIGLIFFYGGESGFLAANAGLSSGVADAVLIPEEDIKLPGLFEYARRCIARDNLTLEDHALFVVAEGVALRPPLRNLIAQELFLRDVIGSIDEFDAPEGLNEDMRNAFLSVFYRLFNAEFGQTTHTPVIIEPRSLVNSVPPSEDDIRFCQRLAYNAVDNALAGYTAFMSSYWLTEYVLVPLSLVAGRQKHIPLHGSFWSNVRSTTGQPKW
jgi:6-phosphofructokinase 1